MFLFNLSVSIDLPINVFSDFYLIPFTFPSSSKKVSKKSEGFFHFFYFYTVLLNYIKFKHTQKYIDEYRFVLVSIAFWFLLLWLSPRFISIGQLSTLLHLHLQPINHIVYVESYYLTVWDILSWGGLHT